MIKNLSLIVLITLVSFSTKAEEDYMNTIATECCKCLSNLSDTLDKEDIYLQLGLCMLKESAPYQKQIKKDYKIDINNFAKDGEQFGEILGVKMAFVCPDAFLRLSNSGILEDDEVEDIDELIRSENTSSKLPSVSGTIQKIEEEFFVVFTLRDNTGKITKYYWLNFIDTGADLISNYKNLTGKSIEIYYNQKEFFDPKISEYRNFNVITKMSLLED